MSEMIKPVKTEEDYNEALETIENLFHSDEGSDDANLRDVLILLVEKYEDDEYPIELPDPISAIKFRMEQIGYSQKDLIPYIGNRSKVSEILSGKRELSLKMIRALHKHLGIPAEVLLQDRNVEKSMLDSNIDFEVFPIKEMKQFGAFNGMIIDNIQDRAEELIRKLIDSIGVGIAIPEFKFRVTKSTRLNAKLNIYALQGWLLHLLHDASKISVPYTFLEDTIDDGFLSSLANLSMMSEGPRLAQEFLLKHGIILIIIHHYKNTYLDGAAYVTSSGQPVIGLTLRYDRIDNFWFNLMHELGHIKLHLKPGNYIADDMSLRNSTSDDEIEQQADKFAENVFFSSTFDLDKKELVSKNEVVSYALKNNIHPAIVAGKIQYTKNNYRLFANMVGRGEIRKCFE